MSPEQIKGALDLDPRSDLYSLGVTLYEIVTGQRPFQGDSEYSIMSAHLEKNPPPPIEVSPNLPAGLSEIIMQALEKDPAKRFQSADAFRNALLHVLKPQPRAGIAMASSQPAAPQPSVSSTVGQPARPRRALWIAVGALIVVAVIVVVALQIPGFRKTGTETKITSGAGSETVLRSSEESAVPATGEAQPLQPMPGKESAIPSGTGAAAVMSSGEISAPALQRKSEIRPAATGKASMVTPAQPAVRPTPEPEVQAAAVPAADGAAAEQIEEIRKQLDLLSIRMDTVKAALSNLKRQQAAAGLGLRADMANAAQRMEYYYGLAETALKNRDPESAQKNLDLVEREVSKLENFLGR